MAQDLNDTIDGEEFVVSEEHVEALEAQAQEESETQETKENDDLFNQILLVILVAGGMLLGGIVILLGCFFCRQNVYAYFGAQDLKLENPE
jgi:hypothetical protein